MGPAVQQWGLGEKQVLRLAAGAVLAGDERVPLLWHVPQQEEDERLRDLLHELEGIVADGEEGEEGGDGDGEEAHAGAARHLSREVA